MTTQSITPVYDLGELARFLDEHPGFSPLLTGADAILCGFRVGDCVLSIGEVQALCGAGREMTVEAEGAGGL